MSNQSQQVVLVTGASAGVGAAAVREFAGRGWHVVATGRSAGKLAAVVDTVRRDTGAEVESHRADFARLADVRRLAHDVASRHPRLDVLANNAGLLAGRRTVTEDGHELTWQVNHLAPFLLTHLLWDRLGPESRVVTTSSEAHRWGRLDLSDPDFERHRWNRWRAYAASKMANIVFTRELARRLLGSGATATAFHPGAVRSDFARGHLGFRLAQRLPKVFVTPTQAAAWLLQLATESLGSTATGGYFVQGRLTAPAIRLSRRGGVEATVGAVVDDADIDRALWELSLEQTAE